MAERDQSPHVNHELWYILLASSIGVLALAGYAGYILYPRFDLPAATGVGLLVLAAGAGIASFFSPCSFPLLVTLLAREAGTDRERGRMQRSLGFATALALGATLFLILIGSSIALGASALFEGVTFTSTVGRVTRLVIGVLLILLGLIQIGVIRAAFGDGMHTVTSPVMRRQAKLRREHPTAGFGLFGFIYILAGFG